MRVGSSLISLSDDIADLAYLWNKDIEGEEELIFHTRRIPRNPFYIAYERVIVEAPVQLDGVTFYDALKIQMQAVEGNEISSKNGGTIVFNPFSNPTDPGTSETYVDESAVDDLLQFVTEVMGAQERERYPVLRITKNVELASLYLKSREGGKIVLGFKSVDGVDRQVEIDDLGYEQFEAIRYDTVINIDALASSPPA